MKSNNIVQDKSYAFAVKIVKLSRILMDEKREYILSKQLMRSGTAIGALIEEAIGGQTDKDFFAKLTMAYKEARETKYWLRLLTDTGFLQAVEAKDMLDDAEELLRLIGSIQKTIRAKMKNS